VWVTVIRLPKMLPQPATVPPTPHLAGATWMTPASSRGVVYRRVSVLMLCASIMSPVGATVVRGARGRGGDAGNPLDRVRQSGLARTLVATGHLGEGAALLTTEEPSNIFTVQTFN
jgi:hypothetical protein